MGKLVIENYSEDIEFMLYNLKKYLGIPYEDKTFDSELVALCVSGCTKLLEMLSNDIEKSDAEDTLYDIIFVEDEPYLFSIASVGKEWLYLYIKLSFDPPTASTLTYLKERLNELEWYIVNYNLGDWVYGEQKHAGSGTSWY